MKSIACVLMAAGLLALSSCGDDGDSGRPATADEQAIRQIIESWMSYLEAGDVLALEPMFDPGYWVGCPTQIRWTEFTGSILSASVVNISVAGEDASASFTLTMAGEGSRNVNWELHKSDAEWKIAYEEWQG